MSSYTKQGVRDLSNIGSKKSKGKKLDMPPMEVDCDHRGHVEESRCGYFAKCTRCGSSWDRVWP